MELQLKVAKNMRGLTSNLLFNMLYLSFYIEQIQITLVKQLYIFFFYLLNFQEFKAIFAVITGVTGFAGYSLKRRTLSNYLPCRNF